MPLSPQTARKLAAARDLLAVLAFCAAVLYGGRAFINSPYLQKERVTQREAAADIETFFRLVSATRPVPLGEPAPDLKAQKTAALGEAEARLDEFRRITVRDLAFILYRSAAAFGDSETRLLWQPRRKYKDPALKFPPFTVAYREGRFFADRAADPALSGAELLAVDGISFRDFIRPALERVSGETPRYRDWLFCRDQFFWWDFPNLIAPDKPLRIKARSPGGKLLEKQVSPVTAGEFRGLSARQAPQAKMIYSQSRLGWLRVAELGASRKARANYDSFFQEMRAKGAETLVMDLTGAADGDLEGANYLAGFFGGWLKGPMEKFSGRSFLLTGPGTGPAGAYFAARFRTLKAGEILGEETGGTAAYYGYPKTFTLPASGLKFSVASRHYTYPGAETTVKPDLPLTQAALRPHKGDLKSYILWRLKNVK